MPRYEFRCQECLTTFEVSRPMSASREPANCPAGHDNTVRLLSTVALSGASTSTGRAGHAAAPAAAGGCCGGSCCG